ncbi:hypothetical protein [Allofournierella massiliensis]|uniref:hypothetical protein n=1 Tax=Allofournierella massiliensis TaxID=1650663 RepID=UPI003566412C
MSVYFLHRPQPGRTHAESPFLAPGALHPRFFHFTPTQNRCKANGNFYALSPKSQEKVCESNPLKVFPRLQRGDQSGIPTPQPLVLETMGYSYHTHFLAVCKHFVIFGGTFRVKNSLKAFSAVFLKKPLDKVMAD